MYLANLSTSENLSVITTANQAKTENEEKTNYGYLSIPYVALFVIAIILICISFIKFHNKRQQRIKYRALQLKRVGLSANAHSTALKAGVSPLQLRPRAVGHRCSMSEYQRRSSSYLLRHGSMIESLRKKYRKNSFSITEESESEHRRSDDDDYDGSCRAHFENCSTEISSNTAKDNVSTCESLNNNDYSITEKRLKRLAKLASGDAITDDENNWNISREESEYFTPTGERKFLSKSISRSSQFSSSTEYVEGGSTQQDDLERSVDYNDINWTMISNSMDSNHDQLDSNSDTSVTTKSKEINENEQRVTNNSDGITSMKTTATTIKTKNIPPSPAVTNVAVVNVSRKNSNHHRSKKYSIKDKNKETVRQQENDSRTRVSSDASHVRKSTKRKPKTGSQSPPESIIRRKLPLEQSCSNPITTSLRAIKYSEMDGFEFGGRTNTSSSFYRKAPSPSPADKRRQSLFAPRTGPLFGMRRQHNLGVEYSPSGSKKTSVIRQMGDFDISSFI